MYCSTQYCKHWRQTAANVRHIIVRCVTSSNSRVTSWWYDWRHGDVMSLSCHSVELDRDDSGNSSSSSSSVSLDQLPSAEPASSTSSSSLVYSDLWQPDYSPYYCGYELADCTDSSDVLLPLHKTVCCALCRLGTVHRQVTVFVVHSNRFKNSLWIKK